jgi:hypothetical protein
MGMFSNDRLARLLDKVNDLQDEITSLRTLFLLAFERLENLMADRGALDAAITTLGSETAALITLAQGLITKGQANAASPIDYTAEIAQIGTIQSNIAAALTNANAAASAPPVGQATPVSSATTSTPPQTGPGFSSTSSSTPPSAPQTATGSNS